MMEKCKTCMNGYPSVSCTNCGSGFRNYSPYSKPTNADRIRGMTDEELAVFLAKIDVALYRANLDVIAYRGATVNDNLDWLTQPAKEE